MQSIGYKLTPFRITGVKPGYTKPVGEDGQSAFLNITEKTFQGKWKVLYYYPKNFTFVCPTEIMAYDALRDKFADRNAVLIGGCTDNEFTLLAWRQSHVGLGSTAHWGFADTRPQYPDQADEDGEYRGNLIDQLGVRDGNEGVALRATLIISPENVIQHITVNNLDVGRNSEEALRVLDALQTGALCECNREVGGCTL
jgi:lipoyl-dependent peroxiredoxin subunit C